ncbi:outer-membrane lipoprotein carrier protein LolA [Parabacteroides sp. OttesenSCG-928-N08]|nr:outer-membrane lipoprotein carrier protein LolA [Parabacteroides sp. OttesenSCG-928-N08]
MKQTITSLLLLCLAILPAAAQNAGELLDKAAAAYKNANGIAASFTVNARLAEQGDESFEGAIQMKGDKFVMLTPDMRIWFDGTTQWVYMTRHEEVNISNPTGDELQQTNPMILLNSYKQNFKVSLAGESTAASGKSAYDVELTPKKKGDIERVTIQIEKSSQLPVRISIRGKNGMATTIQIENLQTNQDQPDSLFRFDEKAYPDVDLIDLR